MVVQIKKALLIISDCLEGLIICVPKVGIEPTPPMGHDFEFVRVCQFRHFGQPMGHSIMNSYLAVKYLQETP